MRSTSKGEGAIDGLKHIMGDAGVAFWDWDFTDANFPSDGEGRTLHLGTTKGEVANRILSVGSMERALLVADMLAPPRAGAPLFQRLSSRGFLTITGRYKGLPVSIVTTLMGMPNMDFVVRESRAVVDGQMAVVRLGTCGALRSPAKLGNFMVASKGAVSIRRNPDAWTLGGGEAAYEVSAPVDADQELSRLLVQACSERVGEDEVVEGVNATADSFYSSQGRLGSRFDDRNESLLEQLVAQHPALVSLEMETFHLLDLARCSKGSVRAAAFCIAAAERYSNRFIGHNLMRDRELIGGAAALDALVRTQLLDDVSTLNGSSRFAPPPRGYVWAPTYAWGAAGPDAQQPAAAGAAGGSPL